MDKKESSEPWRAESEKLKKRKSWYEKMKNWHEEQEKLKEAEVHEDKFSPKNL